jgi:NTE family protein
MALKHKFFIYRVVMATVSFDNYRGVRHSGSPEFVKKEWLLPREKLEIIVSFFKQPKQEIEDPQELQKYCFVKVVKACRKAKYEKIAAASGHLFGLLDERGRSIYQAVIEDEKDPEIVRTFLQDIKQGILPKDSLTYRDYKLSLHYAAGANRCDIFLSVKHRKLNRKDAEGKTPLHVAIENGSTEFVAKLLKLTNASERSDPSSTASIEARFKDSRTEIIISPFSLAIMMGKIECFDLLVNHSPDSECFNEHISNVGNILHLSILFGQTNVLKHLVNNYIEKINGLINSRDGHPFGLTPFSLAASHGDVESMLLLVNFGADIEISDYEQKRALHHAVIARQEETVKLLLMLGAKKAPKDHLGKDPYTYAKGKDAISIEIKDSLTTFPSNSLKNSSPNFYDNYPENRVFQGGGPKGIAYIGALDVLEKRGILPQVKRVAGTSAGAITATFLAVGYSVDEAKKHLMAMQLIEFLDFDGARLSEIIPETKQKVHGFKHASGFLNKVGAVINLLGLLKFTSDFTAIVGQIKNQSGLCKGEVFRQWIAKAIEQKTGDANLTFGELRGLINPRSRYKHLYVFTTKIGANKEIVQLDSEDERWDNLIIADAVRASMSLPGAFEAHILHYKDRPGPLGRRCPCEGQSFIDGGIIYNLPVEAFDKKKYIKKSSLSKEEGECPAFNKRTLAFSLYTPGEEVPKEDTTVNTTFGVISDFLNTRWHAESITRKRVEYNKHRIIKISNMGVGTFEFDLAPEKLEQLVLSGKESVEDFFEKQAKSSRVSTQIFFDTTNERLSSLIRQANKKAPVNVQGRNGVTQLHTAVLDEDVEKIKELLQDPRIDVNIQDDNGDTPLHLTLCARYPSPSHRKEMFQLLIEHPDIDVNIQNKVGDTPVHHAITLFSGEILRKTTPNLRGRNGFTLLHIAANFGYLEIASILLENPKTDVNIQTEKGDTALLLCTRTGKMKIFRLLVNHPKINVNLQESRGRTVLHEALTMCQNMEAINLLMKREDIEINIQDNNGHTPLHLSLLPGCMEAFHLFVSHPTIDLNIQNHDGRTPLHFTLFPTCGLLLKQQNIWIREKGLHEDKLLHLSEFPCNLEALAFLLKCRGIIVNLQDKSGRTPLHSSILSNNMEAFKLLSEHPEINREVPDNLGVSPRQLIELKRQTKERREQPRRVVNEDNTTCIIS